MNLRILFLSITAMCSLFAATTAVADDVHTTIDDTQTRIVKLFGAGGVKNLAGYGTGFLVSPEGHIVTVWSHLLDNDTVAAVLHDGRRMFARVIGADSQRDLAVLKIDGQNLPCFDLAQAISVGPGAQVLVFSNMFKVAVGDEPVTVLHGSVAARTELTARRGRFQVPYSGPIYVLDVVSNNPGAAGGVVTTHDGKLLAMLGREVKNDNSNTWLNYAMPISELKTSIDDIVAGRIRPRDPLPPAQSAGNGYTPADFGLTMVPNVVQRTPAYIEAVAPGTPAAEAKLKSDDLIVFANGELVNSLTTLDAVFRKLSAGEDLQLTIRRGNELISATFRVPRREGDQR